MIETPLKEKKKERGCSLILFIILSCFIVAGIFFFLAGKIFGEDNRNLIFFGVLGMGIVVVLGREILRKNS